MPSGRVRISLSPPDIGDDLLAVNGLILSQSTCMDLFFRETPFFSIKVIMVQNASTTPQNPSNSSYDSKYVGIFSPFGIDSRRRLIYYFLTGSPSSTMGKSNHALGNIQPAHESKESLLCSNGIDTPRWTTMCYDVGEWFPGYSGRLNTTGTRAEDTWRSCEGTRKSPQPSH